MSVVFPGQRLGSTSEFIAGSGTHVIDSFLYSSVLGTRSLQDGKLSILTNRKPRQSPTVGSVVIARVVRVTPLSCFVKVLVVDNVCATMQGSIRRQDIRATEKDKVQVYNSFRPGDIVMFSFVIQSTSAVHQRPQLLPVDGQERIWGYFSQECCGTPHEAG